MLDGELDQELVVVMQGLQQAENMIRAGLERARYNVLQRTQRRGREAEAAYVEVRDGTVFASTYDGAVEVPPPPVPAPRAPGLADHQGGFEQVVQGLDGVPGPLVAQTGPLRRRADGGAFARAGPSLRPAVPATF